jgi:DNA-binding HxlR family transcriptional regulator
VRRTVAPTIPPRVDYDLTDLGRELLEPPEHLGRWAVENQHRIDAARQRFRTRGRA